MPITVETVPPTPPPTFNVLGLSALHLRILRDLVGATSADRDLSYCADNKDHYALYEALVNACTSANIPSYESPRWRG